MPTIHPSSVIDRGAQLAEGVTVGPLCYVGPRAVIGAGTRLVSHVSVLGRTLIGANNTIWPQVVLGADPQDLKFRGEETELTIGDDNDIREMVTAHTGTANGGGATRIGSGNLIMGGVHIAHDCEIGSHCILANNVGLAGHVKIEDHANIGGAVGVHHFVTFGQYCYVGGMSRIVRDVPPFMLVEGHPSSVRGINAIGLTRHRFPPETINRLRECHRRVFRGRGEGRNKEGRNKEGSTGDATTLLQRLDQLAAEFPDDECVQILVKALRQSAAGLYGRYREGLREDDRRDNPAD